MRTAATSRRPRDAGAGGPSAGPLPTREVILDTAERLFAARGVDGIAVRDLAREMGITASSLYNHFPGKQALYDAVVERGVGPIVALVAESWQREPLGPAQMQPTLARLTAHLGRHPHLGRLLQRALLEETGALQALLGRLVASLYREGTNVLRQTARRAGWEPAEVPHLAVALFGLIFAYFTNAQSLQRLAGWDEDPLSPRALAVQRRFLERAMVRLLEAPVGAARSGRPRPRTARTRRRNIDG